MHSFAYSLPHVHTLLSSLLYFRDNSSLLARQVSPLLDTLNTVALRGPSELLADKLDNLNMAPRTRKGAGITKSTSSRARNTRPSVPKGGSEESLNLRARKGPGVTKSISSPARNTRSGGRKEDDKKPFNPPMGWIPTFQRKSLESFENENKHGEMIAELNSQIPDSQERWGDTITGAISSLKKKGRAPKVQNYFSGRGSLAPLFSKSSDEEPTLFIPNSPDRSPLLGVPVAVRERIYGFLLSDSKPVIVGPDWETLQGKVLRYNGLQYVCKQIGDEASKFMYSHNVFLAMLRETQKTSAFDKTLFIDPKFLSLFRNVVINCPKDNWDMDWHEKAALAVDKLADANAFLTSLTIVVCPSRGTGTSTTALGLEANPIHFADFFYLPGPFMTSIRKLRSKVLNIIIKRRITAPIHNTRFTTGMKRLLTSVNLTYLHARTASETTLANEDTAIIAHDNALALENELQALKSKFEAIFEDHDKALQDGLCRELAEDEAITDGMALATRK